MNGFMDRYDRQWHRFDDSQAPDAVLQLRIQENSERDENGKPQFFFIHNNTVWMTATYYPYLDRELAADDRWTIEHLFFFPHQGWMRFYHNQNQFTFKTFF